MKRQGIFFALTIVALTLSGTTMAQTDRPSSRELLAALAHVKVISQEIRKSEDEHSVLVQIKNDSDMGFGWVTVSCRIMKGDELVEMADAYITNLQPGEIAGEQATYSVTPENADADRAICRPAIGL